VHSESLIVATRVDPRVEKLAALELLNAQGNERMTVKGPSELADLPNLHPVYAWNPQGSDRDSLRAEAPLM
jgi:hypothetical protein